MPIKVLIVEDSPIATLILQRMLNAAPQIQVVGTATTGVEALAMLERTQPDVICTDLHMPKMDGLEFTTEVMATYPRPILVISTSVQDEDTHHVFELLQAGAVDIFPKPRTGLTADYEKIKDELIHKIRILSGVKVMTRRRKLPLIAKPTVSGIPLNATPRTSTVKAVIVGASTGGPQALQTIFSAIPKNFPVPIIAVQHISAGFLQGFLDWLNNHCSLTVQIAESGQFPTPGQIYFPPEKRHLEIDNQGRFCYSDMPPYLGHRPSVTVTMQSMARYYQKSLLGVLLTGMGRDGAEGMQGIKNNGGWTIAQDQNSCVVFGMPKEAIALNAAQQILPLDAIAPALIARIA
ncbi:MAG: chemotaxis-specific protein-glutamate methyltransferase CheB [Jaaginema sp. PMC 1079.18]|nr:chemotaxis-specific protein-glutamate methyltransferase CheB [Jaaginema sp. PMC 1080.18]MEC4851801.1 chemotaxis-specific protein-glutamate methyltransferase CheB [Jaaginema sp. PMC 1079.18]MEC4867205.1 chemotaxis-specific protein-glutamate methyltransferase CheB [Jaaginema sp. PMC 1078.18]